MSIVHHLIDGNAFFGVFCCPEKTRQVHKVRRAVYTYNSRCATELHHVDELDSIRAHLNGVTFSAASSQAP